MDEKQMANNISKLLERVRFSALKSQRDAATIQVLAVSKTRPAADIRLASSLGLIAFGENYLQEAIEKINELQDLDLQWHFIGPIQSNKTRAIAENFDWVHSLERGKIAQRLHEQRPPELRPLQVCIQVNISQESSKSGASIDSLPTLIAQIRKLPRLQLRGLMAIPAPSSDLKEQHRSFAQLRQLMQELLHLAPEMDTLSMGMSADLEAAIEEGSNIVRVGTDIFGARINATGRV